MSTPTKEFHDVMKRATEKLRDEAGTFVSLVTVHWEGGELREIAMQMGTSVKYESEKEEKLEVR